MCTRYLILDLDKISCGDRLYRFAVFAINNNFYLNRFTCPREICHVYYDYINDYINVCLLQ